MRARIVAMTTHVPTQMLFGAGGQSVVVQRGVEIDLKILAPVDTAEWARMEPHAEIILAPIPVRSTDGVTEGAMATWADLIANGYEGSDLARAAAMLLPEVTALRREAEARQQEVKWLRGREERPLLDKLKEIAAHLGCDVEVADGVFTLKPKPIEEDPDAGDW